MSETLIFVVGIVIFAITVYGAMMAGGIALTNVSLDEDVLPAPDIIAPPTAATDRA